MAQIGYNQPRGTSGVVKAVRLLAGLILVVAAVGAFLSARGCETARATRELKEGERVRVVVKGEVFRLEPALDEPTRIRGLGGRATIEPDGGMIFVFPLPHRMDFIMRDCLTDIDIAYLDDSGRVLALHAMKVEEPRRPDEPPSPDPKTIPDPYDMRLKKYSSRFNSRIAVEFAGGTLARLGVKEGDVIEVDLAPLKARAK